ncbi:MAG: YigZ family protein [Chryseosolibacter sp.]
MTSLSYRTIAKPAEGRYKEKGSRFLAFAFPVESEPEIKAHLAQLGKKFFDARHHCFAWMLGADKKSFRAFDDGEPNHSAGDPILGQIRSKDLTDVLVVVVRYFGGVKLGVGGLIAAYKQAAEDALNHADIIEKEVTGNIRIVYEYQATPEIMRLIKEFDLAILSQTFEADCSLTADYKLRDREKLFGRLDLMLAMGVNLQYS